MTEYMYSAGVVRQMGSHNRMQVLPSRFEWERWKDDMVCWKSPFFLLWKIHIMEGEQIQTEVRY